jgi:hypothetical protein
MDPIHVLLTGATGLVGGALLPRLAEQGHHVTALTRRAPAASSDEGAISFASWDGTTPPASALDGVHTVIHLAGEPVFGGIPTTARKQRMVTSRVDSTRAIVAQIAALPQARRPKRLICASAVGYYGDRGDEWLEESSGPGEGFLSQLCQDWEREADQAMALGTAVTRMRFGIVLARDGGALSMLRRIFGANLGGRLGSGRQWFPWVHLDDTLGALLLALEGRLDGAVNVVSPAPVTNQELTRVLAKQMRRVGFWAVPSIAMRLALGDIADELLGSKRVRPTALEQSGYEFAFSDLIAALERELS